MTRRRLVATSLAIPAGLALPGLAAAQEATPVAPEATPAQQTSGGWPLYGHDLTGAKATSGGVSSANVAELGPIWEVEVGGPVSATPVISDGVAYIGSYDGNLYAIDLFSGELLWTYATGADVLEPNLQIPLGITGSAAVANGVVYVGDAAANVHAIDAASGEALWTVNVEQAANGSIWSSPVILGERLYVGIASIAKEEGFRGSVIALETADGSTIWQTYMVPEGADGAGVFAVPAIDETRGALYVGTQNAYSPNPAPYGDPISIVALDLATGELRWAFHAPEDGETAPTDDVGFSASPNLFSVEIDGETRDLVGNGQKSGKFWALDRDTGEVVWQTRVSPAGFLGGMEGASAVANGVIAVPATDWPEFEGPAAGMVTVLDAATGEELWSAEQTAPAASPAAISDDVVFHAGFDGILHAYALASGEELWSFELGASVSGGIAVSDGVVVLGAATPQFAEFITPGNTIYGFAVGAGTATPEVATPVA
jgi:polyvinyl alcohol dehydrogenase (cytochrome)